MLLGMSNFLAAEILQFLFFFLITSSRCPIVLNMSDVWECWNWWCRWPFETSSSSSSFLIVIRELVGFFFAVVANWQQLLDGMGISNHRWWSRQDEELNTHSGICGFGVWKLFFRSNAINFCLLGWRLCCSKILSWYDPLPLSSSHVLFRCNSCWSNPQPSMCLFSPSSFKTKKINTKNGHMKIYPKLQCMKWLLRNVFSDLVCQEY